MKLKLHWMSADIHQPSHTPQDFHEIKLLIWIAAVPHVLNTRQGDANELLWQI